MDQSLIVGVDIGGTKTQVRIVSADDLVADVTLPTASWRVREWQRDSMALAALIEKHADGRRPAAMAVGAQSCNTDAQCEAFRAALAKCLPGRIRVFNDSELMVPAAGFAEGIGVVAGTGSIAVARSADGHMVRAGGWGWILGDEGSGPALVREAARAIRRVLDRGPSDDPVVPALMASLGTDDPTLLGRLLDESRGAANWGRHVLAVFTAADAGSLLARQVIEDGAAALADLVGTLMARGIRADRVVAGGSVIVEQARLMTAFVEAMSRLSPDTQVSLLREAPVAGAVTLAQRLLAAEPMPL